jgi:proteasome accessory factor B
VTDPAERLVNLALFVASAPEPVTAARIQAQVAGYPAGQAEAAFLRMFERDKEDLLVAGIAFEVVRDGDSDSYRLDRQVTFAGELTLTPEQTVLVRAAGAAMLGDPSFPFAEDLRLALAKISAASGYAPPAGVASTSCALTADEAPRSQAETVAAMAAAISARKVVSFAYTNAAGTSSKREVEPLGVFARDGRWYVVGRDRDADGMRVFAVSRMEGLAVNPVRPKSPDFEAPEGFDVAAWMLLPFQFGPEHCEALVRLTGPASRRAHALAGGQGTLERLSEAAVLWRVGVADVRALAGWAVEHGPGIEVLEPAEAREAAASGLARVVADHGA